MFIKVLLLVSVFVGIAFIALGFNIFFRKKKFPQTEIGRNKEMRKLGITCAKSEEIKCRREIDKITGKMNCSGCGLAS